MNLFWIVVVLLKHKLTLFLICVHKSNVNMEKKRIHAHVLYNFDKSLDW